MKGIYLDNASSAKPVDSILETIKPYIEELWHNPSSLYSQSAKVRNDIETVREQIAKLIHAKPEEIYMTSGASESNNWVIRGFDDACGCNIGKIITTPIEHMSLIKAVNNRNLRSLIGWVDVDCEGIVDLNSLKEHRIDCLSLVSIIGANNEIGTVQDIKSISEFVRSQGGIFHTDATQMLPHMEINVKKMGIDMLSASAQKLGGLKGTGFLYIKKSIKDMIDPLIHGEQERGMRGGTENVIGIIALGEAIKHLNYKEAAKVEKLRDKFLCNLEQLGCKLVGSRSNRLPNNLSIMLPEYCGAEEMLLMLDMDDVQCSVGSACNSRSKQMSHVLEAIGLTDEESARVIRFTLPSYITIEDIDRATYEIEKCIKVLSMSGSDLPWM